MLCSFSPLVGIECTDTAQCGTGDVCCPETDQCEDPLAINASACGKTRPVAPQVRERWSTDIRITSKYRTDLSMVVGTTIIIQL